MVVGVPEWAGQSGGTEESAAPPGIPGAGGRGLRCLIGCRSRSGEGQGPCVG